TAHPRACRDPGPGPERPERRCPASHNRGAIASVRGPPADGRLAGPRPTEPGPLANLSSRGRSIPSRREKDSVTSHETPRPIGINLPSHAQDPDPEETREWLESFDGLVEHRGPERAAEVVQSLIQHARDEDLHLPDSLATDYINTIAVEQQPEYPG